MLRLLRAAGALAAATALLLGTVSTPALASQEAVVPAAAAANVGPAQTITAASRRDVLIVLDTSGSMADKDRKGVVKIAAAKTALQSQMQEVPVGTGVGLMTYPAATGRTASGCYPATTRMDVTSSGPTLMGAALGALPAPDGDTPTSDALLQAAAYIKAQSLQNTTIVLVSDGESNCGADPCETAKKLKAENVDVTVNAVGFDISSQGQTQLECIAGAGGGIYASAEDSDALMKALREQLGGGLSLKVDAPTAPVPLFEQLVPVKLTVSVAPGHSVSNVQVHLEETGDRQGATVRRPYMALGNFTGGGQGVPTLWQIRPPSNPKLDGTTFRASVSADGTSPVTQDFTIKFSHDLPTGMSPQGQLSAFKNIVVMGDSYSSGEGTGNTQRPYFTVGAQAEECHRSKNQYANWIFPPDQVRILACSGAVTRNVYAEGKYGEQSQVSQLRGMLATGYRPDAVFMSISGNDIGFKDIATSCATSALKADALTAFQIVNDKLAILLKGLPNPLSACPASAASGDAFVKTSDLVKGVPGWVSTTLGKTAQAFSDSGVEVPPIIVVKYPALLSVDSGSVLKCGGSSPFQSALLAQAFGDFRKLQGKLNDAIDQGVQDAQTRLHINAYAASTADAIPPAHNLCSDDPWFVPLTVSGAAAGSPEMLHPNVQGHQAIASAINGWAASKGDQLKPAAGSIGPTPWWMGATAQWWPTASQVTLRLGQLGALSGGSVGYGPNSIHVVGGAPLTGVTLYVHSTPLVLGHIDLDKDGNGTLDVDLQAADLPPGDHTVNAIGTAADGRPAVATVPVHIDQPFPTAFWGLLALAVALIVAALVAISRSRRIR